jgi:hypothetical protein
MMPLSNITLKAMADPQNPSGFIVLIPDLLASDFTVCNVLRKEISRPLYLNLAIERTRDLSGSLKRSTKTTTVNGQAKESTIGTAYSKELSY